MMQRRNFLILSATALLHPGAARPQQRSAMPVIGYLSMNSPEIPVGEVAAFKEGLKETGIVEGRDVAIEYRFAEGNYAGCPVFAAELVARHVDVVAASGYPAAMVAKSAITSIPVVFTIGVDPVASGLVESVAKPGGNLTGVTQLITVLVA